MNASAEKIKVHFYAGKTIVKILLLIIFSALAKKTQFLLNVDQTTAKTIKKKKVVSALRTLIAENVYVKFLLT